MIEALIILVNLIVWTPIVGKSFYYGVSSLIADHVLHEALICTEEIRKPSECQTRALKNLNAVLPWKDNVHLLIHMNARQYQGDLKIVFDEDRTLNRTLHLEIGK